MEQNELPKEEAERRAREVAHRMLTTPKKPAASQKRDQKATKKAAEPVRAKGV